MSWPEKHLSKALQHEFLTRLAQRRFIYVEGPNAPHENGAIQRGVLAAMAHERELDLRQALDALVDAVTDGPLEPSPALIAVITLPAELVLLRAALT